MVQPKKSVASAGQKCRETHEDSDQLRGQFSQIIIIFLTLVTELTLLLYEAAKNRIRLCRYISKPLLGEHVFGMHFSNVVGK